MDDDNTQRNAPKFEARFETNRIVISPGGSLQTTILLKNLGSETDFLELTLMGIPSEWFTLSERVIRLGPGGEGSVILSLDVPEPPEGRLGDYELLLRVNSQANPHERREVEARLTIGRQEIQGRILIELENNQYSVVPGSSVEIPIRVKNNGLEVDHFRLAVEGLPTSWLTTSTPVVRVEPGEEKSLSFIIKPPRSPSSKAGRNPFVVRLLSQLSPQDRAEMDCTLTIGAFSQFSSELSTKRLDTEEVGRVLVRNLGNIQDTYRLSWRSQNDALQFTPGPQQQLRIAPGEAAAAEFSAEPVSRPIYGGEFIYPYTTIVQSSDRQTQALNGEAVAKAMIPTWVLPAVVVGCIILAALAGIIFFGGNSLADSRATQTAQAPLTQIAMLTIGAPLTQSAQETLAAQVTEIEQATAIANLTQTAVANMTEAAAEGQRDDDGDGLTNDQEAQIGTDPQNPDTDGDGLGDGAEVNVYRTNPLNPDSDADRLNDGSEIDIGTNPLNPDTDNDRLIDGAESPPCPNPLNPDTDSDGIIDGIDLDPCNPNNPSLTATAIAGLPSPVPPTATVPAGVTPQPPPVSGTFAFVSDLDGNQEIYLYRTSDGSVTRLTFDAAVDTQPAISPNGQRIAFASNRSGNFDIYVMSIDGTGVTNLTNNPANDTEPTWSPDNSMLAFTTDRDGNNEVYSMASDGSNPLNLTQNPANDGQADWFNDSRIILGTGQWIAFTTNRDGNNEVYLMKTDGSGPVNLSNNSADDSQPSDRPDGQRVLFTTNRDGNQEIYQMNSDGTNQRNMTNNPADDQQSDWSPDSNWMVYVTNRDGSQELYVAKLDNSNNGPLLPNPNSNEQFPSWR
jgi:Tol biopolymer transport system component